MEKAPTQTESPKTDQASNPGQFIRFLGTAGTRFVMLSQIRASGGIWFSYGTCRGVVDPGPGSLVRICKSNPALSPLNINTLVLTHRHIDHSSDMNVLSEGMTLRSPAKKGQVLVTRDAVEGPEPVLLPYFAKKIESIHFHEDKRRTRLDPDVTVESVLHRHHGVECHGLIFRGRGLPTWGLISDTRALPSFPKRYAECRMLIVNTTLYHPWSKLDHFSASEVVSLLEIIHPELVLITHFGPSLLDAGPERVARRLSTARTRVIAASDGMTVDMNGLTVIDDPQEGGR